MDRQEHPGCALLPAEEGSICPATNWIRRLAAAIAILCLFAGTIGARASDSPYLVTARGTHQVRLIEEETAALENILEMIDRARNSIDLEYFIFLPDRSGRLVLQALVKKAGEGVRIRILLDYVSQQGLPGLDEFYQAELASHGITVRYFNVASLVEVWKAGFRNHRKFIIVDGRELVTGGRNIADEYFGLGVRMNYLDRDIWITGPMVTTASRNFELFWSAPLVESLPVPEDNVYQRQYHPNSSRAPAPDASGNRPGDYLQRVQQTRDTLVPSSADGELRRKVAMTGGPELQRMPLVTVHKLTFVSDKPVPGEPGRVMSPYRIQLLEHATRSLLIENYTFLVKGPDKAVLVGLAKRGVRITVLTNSFYSEPNFVLAELSHSREHMAVDRGMEVYCYSSHPLPDQGFFETRERPSIWGLHGKSMVIDGKDSVIGSYNFDPRSARINLENTLCVHDSPEFAGLVEQATLRRMRNAYKTRLDGRYGAIPCFNGLGRTLAIIFRPVAELFADQL